MPVAEVCASLAPGNGWFPISSFNLEKEQHFDVEPSQIAALMLNATVSIQQ
jgi:hypothetical protein